MISVRRSLRRAPGSSLTLATATLLFIGVTLALAEHRPAVDRDRVELPYTETSDSVPRDAAVISVDAGGIIRASDGVALSAPVADAEAVRRFALALVERDPERAFVIRADRTTRWEIVHQAATALREAGAHGIFLLSRQRVLDEEF